MSDFDDLDSLLGPLREPATPAELASERVMIDLMVTSHRNPKGTPMFNSRRARVATLIAAGVIGFGGVAAAGGGLGRTAPDDTPDVDPALQGIEIEEEIEVDEEVEVEEVEEVEEITTTTAAAAVEESDDDTFTDEIAKATLAAVAVAEADDEVEIKIICVPEGNHGKTVSAVAHGDVAGEVRDAAHSDCGKTDDDDAAEVDDDDDDAEVDDDEKSDDSVDDESDDSDDESDDDESDDSDDDDADEDESDDSDADDDADEEAGRGSNNGNGNGHGNGNGKSGNDD